MVDGIVNSGVADSNEAFAKVTIGDVWLSFEPKDAVSVGPISGVVSYGV